MSYALWVGTEIARKLVKIYSGERGLLLHNTATHPGVMTALGASAIEFCGDTCVTIKHFPF